MVGLTASEWTTNRAIALIIGIIFLVIGILGLIFDTTSGSILGFDVDLVLNFVHLLTGILGIAAAMTGWSRRFNQIFGIIYLIIGLAGLIPAFYIGDRLFGLIHANTADHFLHLIVGVFAAAIGFFINDYADTTSTTTDDTMTAH